MDIQYLAGLQATYDPERKVLIIEGQAIDDTVNLNHWQVPETELDYFASQLPQVLIDHKWATDTVKGRVKSAYRHDYKDEQGRTIHSVRFIAEVTGEPEFLIKLQREYLTDVSPMVVGAECICSLCRSPTRNPSNYAMKHLCLGAHEIVQKPQWKELSIVAAGAYPKNKFKVIGFAASMNANQLDALQAKECHCANLNDCKSCGIGVFAASIQGTAQPPEIHGSQETEPQQQEGTEMSEKTEQKDFLTKADFETFAKALVAAIKEVSAEQTKHIDELVAAMKPSREEKKAEPAGQGKVATPESVAQTLFKTNDFMAIPENGVPAYFAEFQKASRENMIKGHE